MPGQVSPENGVPAYLEIEDLKRKVARLIEQVSQNRPKWATTPQWCLELTMENQIIQWRYCLPDKATYDEHEHARIATAIECEKVNHRAPANNRSYRRESEYSSEITRRELGNVSDRITS